ncbi:6-phosphogluconolactonase [Candidatus Methylacidiphilum fumarolicum]|uniref:6-phosphogluconolactonase n=3 Tax=Candidatus Methylacidiphilum fumarolicum TaxID=591154 RepID=I0JY31_METFB|nr:6-phosphogluconolactonase [Candidatus Methylacidiphilum fumarolicum]AEH40981.1 6-phosphogluconolactonase/glucosamine-6-phosphate isomerase/deaminase [Methylacidiphilum fumariolicum SolV]MBW6414303.1 6-phosphogluconolactonase [Candidatus Methylacidiphilum fumarolicum]TFE67048.1 6-phosphogluconolactonase [Candidatus Methylacidiphilum fumarolicum]TFE72636.1 6-phosphogluconolactonase [Candidatus Methylacidiphilum fumarolicum]TFE73730.1 6-phosphogluconolactonase [Candidatus Methylacidiphilum fum
MNRMDVISFERLEEWLVYLTLSFKEIVKTSLSHKPICHVALSGGSTPVPFYERLCTEALPWEKICFWLGDERWVPSEDPQSNEGMIRRTLGATNKEFQFYGWHLSEEPSQAAALYEKMLLEKVGNPPVFDLILLGIGEDGHTASLFPDSKALEEKEHYTALSLQPSSGQIRLTFTFPLINMAHQIWFLVSGNKKQPIIEKVLSASPEIPAGKVIAKNKKLIWLKA